MRTRLQSHQQGTTLAKDIFPPVIKACLFVSRSLGWDRNSFSLGL